MQQGAKFHSSLSAAQGEPPEETQKAMSWQYFGYPAFAEWMAASNDCFVLRRYSRASARCLLRLQHEIARISAEIDTLDRESRNRPPGYGTCDSIDDDEFPERPKLIEQMEVLLQRYCV